MKKRLLLAALIGSQALNGTADTYFLQEKETISDLLYNRLKISPIYRSGYLKKILDFNNLDLTSAQKLPIGQEIKLPSDIPVEQSVVAEPEVPVETEVVSSSVENKLKQKWIAGLTFEYLNGDNSDDASFSIQVMRPTLSYYLQKTFSDHFLEAQVTASYFYLFKDENRVGPSNNPLGEIGLGYGYSIRPDFAVGLKGQYQNEFYLKDKPKDKYQFLFPWIYGIGPMIKFGSEQDWTLSYLMVPGQTIRDDLKTKHNYSIRLLHERKIFSHDLQIGLNYMDNSTSSFNGQKFGLSLGYVF